MMNELLFCRNGNTAARGRHGQGIGAAVPLRQIANEEARLLAVKHGRLGNLIGHTFAGGHRKSFH